MGGDKAGDKKNHPVATPIIPNDSIIRQWKKKRQDTKVARRGIGGQDVPHPVARGIIAWFGWFQTILMVTARFQCS